MITSNDKTKSKLDDHRICAKRARRYSTEIKLNATNIVGISYSYYWCGVILSSTRSKREMWTTVRLLQPDAIRNNGLLVRKDKVE